ncbi:DUF3850 domain-containing protein [Klebsiella grimontii]|uniref:DUF3850 domain-containing protein n=1 Tax=Klebsiella grimontii TaxID=2058152 RepID=UPI001CD02804|nr:DUF3850 domain-containing protein [Klebsiella grimontii]
MISKLTREPITHELKIYPEFFSAVCTGVKRAELRKNDRDYRVGDSLHLLETPRGSCHSTGEFINATITHIADVGEWMPGYVLLSIEREAMDRKAAMDSEPVAWLAIYHGEVYDEAIGITSSVVEAQADRFGWESALTEIIPLYRHAQPAPAVTFYRDGIEASAKWIDQQREAYDSEHGWSDPDTGTFEFGNDAQREYSSTLEELAEGIRALHPNVGNSPVIPDTWIPVSERMPEGSEEVLCAKEFDGPGDWRKKVGYLLAGKWTVYGASWAPTHWMPLPNSPQEAK